jgi:hypothetical protein
MGSDVRPTRMDEVRRLDILAKRVAKLEAVKMADEQPFVMAVHSGSMTLTGGELDRLLKQIDGKTRGIPSHQGI